MESLWQTLFIMKHHTESEKQSSVSSAKMKAKHKHQYVKAFGQKGGTLYPISFCKICGKIDDLSFGMAERIEGGKYRKLPSDEMRERHNDWKIYPLNDIFQKYLDVNL